VLLPHGATLARLDASLTVEVLDEAAEDRLPVRALGSQHDRGRSPLDPAAQAAESHVRAVVGEPSLTAFATVADGPAGETSLRLAVRHRDGRRWLVGVRRGEAAALPESCGKPAVSVTVWDPVILEL
jgi:hypothetical protein